MNVGKNIKKLRRERDMTQEDLAQTLSISPQAVSRWECGDGLPDLSLIPALCSLFDVTADSLLGIDIDRKQEKIEEITERAYTYSGRGYYKEAKEVLQTGLATYPNSEKLLSALMYAWYGESSGAETEEERLRCHAESIALGEKLLGISTDDEIRQGAIQILCYTYAYRGEREKARTLAGKMPKMFLSRESLMSRVERGDAQYRANMDETYTLQDMLLSNMTSNPGMDDGNRAYNEDERELLREKAIAFLELLYEDGNFGFAYTRLAKLSTGQALYAAGKQDEARTLAHLEKAADCTLRFLDFTQKEEFTYTCLLFRGKKVCGNEFTTGHSDNDAAQLLNFMRDTRFDFVRDSGTFAEITDRLKPHAGKWEISENP